MAVRFVQPYRFSEAQLDRMIREGVVPARGATLLDGVPARGGAPIRFSVNEFQRLGQAGVLDGDTRVELMDGEVIRMAAAGGAHSTAVFDIDDFLHAAAGPDVRVAMQSDLVVRDAQPVPDLMLLRRADEVRGRVPDASACVLVVEVSDSTARADRIVKRELYARGGVPEYWVVDLTTRTVVQHLRPIGGEYAQVAEYGPSERFVCPALGGRDVPVASLIRPDAA